MGAKRSAEMKETIMNKPATSQSQELHSDPLAEKYQDVAYRLARMEAERDALKERMGKLEEALRAVLAEADRNTDAFINARELLVI